MALRVVKCVRYGLRTDADIVAAWRGVGAWATEVGFNTIDRSKVVTAASELARNTVVYGRGGVMALEIVYDGFRDGLRVIFTDQGPGIADIPLALEDGFSTGGSLGLGLPGARRLVDEFEIESTVGVGTCVTIVRWKP